MQIVIDISNEEYEKIKENDCGLFNGRIYQMIRKGTPLPEGHRRLIDEQWQELKETIIELCDNDGTATQQEICKFLANLMDILEKQMQELCENAIT